MWRICSQHISRSITYVFCEIEEIIENLILAPVEEEMEGDERTALLLYTPSYQKRSGIATECCEKRCSLNYLKTYCCAGFSNTKPASTKRSAYLNEDYT